MLIAPDWFMYYSMPNMESGEVITVDIVPADDLSLAGEVTMSEQVEVEALEDAINQDALYDEPLDPSELE